MTDTTHIPDPDDEPIFTTPNLQRIRRAGELARCEQAKLEQLLRLRDGRTARPG